MTNLLDNLVELGLSHARIIVLGLGQELMPTWLVRYHNKEGKEATEILGTPWRDLRERDLAKLFILAKFRVLKVEAFSFVSEAWMATMSTQEEYEEHRRSNLGVEDRVDRVECVISFSRDRSGHRFKALEIERDWQGKAVGLHEREAYDAEGYQSWMWKLPLA